MLRFIGQMVEDECVCFYAIINNSSNIVVSKEVIGYVLELSTERYRFYVRLEGLLEYGIPKP